MFRFTYIQVIKYIKFAFICLFHIMLYNLYSFCFYLISFYFIYTITVNFNFYFVLIINLLLLLLLLLFIFNIRFNFSCCSVQFLLSVLFFFSVSFFRISNSISCRLSIQICCLRQLCLSFR